MNIRPLSNGFFRLKATIRNDGAVAAENVDWTITLDGGAFIGGSSSGTIPNIAAGGSEEVTTGFILGIGATTITVTADITTGASDTRVQTGTVLLFFIKVNPGGG
jgi:hypothetical protein